jgi:glycosyltransferase involved in cell wall biosynthesis
MPSAHFYVAGHGKLEEWVRDEIRRHGMEGYFHVLGRLPNAARLSACADVFVLCSSWEGRPVALMEALASGTPAVVTAVGGMPGVVRDNDNGRLVPPGDPVAVAAALLPLLQDATMHQRLSMNALNSSSTNDISHAARTIEDRYVELVRLRQGQMGSTAVA